MEKQFENFWNNLKSVAQEEWSLLEGELEGINGDFDKFVNSVKEKYKLTESEAKEKAEKLYKDLDELKWDGTEEMIKGRAQELWGRITNDDWENIKGSKTKIVGYIKHHFGKSTQEALVELDKLTKS